VLLVVPEAADLIARRDADRFAAVANMMMTMWVKGLVFLQMIK
jgi:hypothetical protein